MTNEFPFPKLLSFLDEEKDQIEFMKVAAEVGLGPTDMELAKLLLALQLYKAFYATVPRDIKAVHVAALKEMRNLRDEVKFLADRTSSDAVKIGQWAEQIDNSILRIQPKAVAESLHKRLLEDALAAIGGSVQALVSAYGRIDAATGKLNTASDQAERSIHQWQILTLRRVWFSAFAFCFAVTAVLFAALWFFYLKH